MRGNLVAIALHAFNDIRPFGCGVDGAFAKVVSTEVLISF